MYVNNPTVMNSSAIDWPPDSTLARHEPARAKSLGAVYTPRVLADWLSRLLCDSVGSRHLGSIVDPACGEGALLRSVRRTCIARKSEARLTGIDIDEGALATASLHLPGVKFSHGDILASQDRPQFEGLIANPPWGASLPRSAEEYRFMGFSLANGQFDSYDLFLELGLRLVRSGGSLAWIVPDSIFAHEHSRTRRLLTESCQIELIARLGEGFFPGVYRGTVVLLLKNSPPKPGHRVQCMRLAPDQRQLVMRGALDLSDVQALAALVPQSRFLASGDCLWDIDASDRDQTVLSQMEQVGGQWTEGLRSSRGVEISKHGKVLVCRNCSLTSPFPKAIPVECVECGSDFSDEAFRVETITATRDADLANAVPFIVGEDVGRHSVKASRLLQLGLTGINYKSPDLFASPKLLVRKTGVGLKAAVDESGSFTNQVVFSYSVRPKCGLPNWYLDYLEGVLCSRAMFAFHLKRGGETEWRSHPYVTQATLAKLPIPAVREGSSKMKLAQQIAAATRRMRMTPTLKSDLAIEAHVARLYGLDEMDYKWVMDVIGAAQHLEPVRTLLLPSDVSIRSALRLSDVL